MDKTKQETPTRNEVLKKLREAHAQTVKKAQNLVRDQKQLHQGIIQAICETPKTIPEIASEVGQPTHEILWYVMVMKKYGDVVEAGMCGDYPRYQRAKESQA